MQCPVGAASGFSTVMIGLRAGGGVVTVMVPPSATLLARKEEARMAPVPVTRITFASRATRSPTGWLTLAGRTVVKSYWKRQT